MNNFKGTSFILIPNAINLTYVEDSEIASESNSNSNIYNTIISVIIILLLLNFMIKQREKNTMPTNISLSLIIAGGFSNLLDRLFRGQIIDYIDISQLCKFPAFNLAYIFIIIGWVMFAFIIAKFTTTIKFRKSKYVDNKGE